MPLLLSTCTSAYICNKPSITNGRVLSEKQQLNHNEEYQVECNTGYYINGSDVIICGGDGSFNHKPNCTG